MTGYGLREHMILAIAGVFASQDHDRHCRRASLLAQLSAQRARGEAKYGPAEAMQARMEKAIGDEAGKDAPAKPGKQANATVTVCPCCKRPLMTARAAQLVANAIHPIKGSK